MQTKHTILIGLLAAGLVLGGCVDAKSKFEIDVQTKIGVVGEQMKTLAEVNTTVGEKLETLADVKNDIQAVGNKVGFVTDKLEKLVEQSQHVSVTAEQIGNLEQVIRQQLAEKIDLMHKEITAESIHYGGAGWVVLGAGLVVLLFLATGVAVVAVATRNAAKFKSLLTMVTSAVKDSPPEVQDAVKSQIEHVTSNGGPWGISHKEALAQFTRAVGTFVPKLTDSTATA